MIELVLHAPRVQVASLPNDEKALIFVDEPSGITVTTALEEHVAEVIAEALASSGIEIARKLPGDARQDGHS